MTINESKIKYDVGDILEVASFAGPNIHKKVIEKENKAYTVFGEEINVVGFRGCFVRRKDILALKKNCVPYAGNEKPSKTISWTYDWQILRVVKKGSKNGRK
jgi:hypothetical protein